MLSMLPLEITRFRLFENLARCISKGMKSAINAKE